MTASMLLSSLSLRRLAVALLALGVVIVSPALAQRSAPHEAPPASAASSTDAQQQNRAGSDAASSRAGRAQSAGAQLPADVSTEHALDVGARTLTFTATAGTIPLSDGEGALQAEVAYIAYVAHGPVGTRTEDRPVTFLFNGGPGAASAYLNIGAVGPWRVPLERVAPSVQPALVPNAETWLDFTDLVFIDPPGTGYSRIAASGDAARRHFWSIDGDAEALAVVIRKWLEKTGRQTSTKFIAGESYGGFRAPKIAKALQSSEGVGIRGLVLISPVLDFAGLGQRRHAPMSWVAHLPSMAAAALESKGQFDRDALRDVEQYASGDYLRDLIKGDRDPAAIERMSMRVAALTGLDPALVRRMRGRVDNGTFQRELHRDRGLVGSAYDPSITAFDPTPGATNSRFADPMLEGLTAPLTSAMTDLYQRLLKWRVEKPYRLLARDVTSHWQWGRGRTSPEVVDDLRNVLASDASVRVLVAHGATDLVTPYFGNQLLLDQLPTYGSADRVKLSVYAGGHMFYNRDASRRELRTDAEALYRAAMPPREQMLRN